MSDLVVYNLEGDRIFKWPVYNTYLLGEDAIIIVSDDGSEQMPFEENVIGIPGMVSLEADGVMTFNQSGMYSIKAYFNIDTPGDEDGHDIVTSLRLKNNPDFINYLVDVVGVVVSPTSTVTLCKLSVSWVGYFAKGYGFNITILNASLTGSITVTKAETALTIARIY